MSEAAVQDFKCLVTKQRSRRISGPSIFQVKLRGMLNPNLSASANQILLGFPGISQKKILDLLRYGRLVGWRQ